MNELTRTPETVGAEIRGLTAQAKQMTLWFGIEIGRRLCEVKEMIGHGEWLPYLKAQTEFSQSTASRFMTLYREYGAQQQTLFGAESNYPTLNNLSISNALRLLALPENERESFAEEHDVEHMSARELEELIQEKKAAEDERDLYEQKLAEQMGAAERLKKDAETAAQEAEARCRELAETQAQIRALQENIRTLESRPVEVAVQVDEGAVAKAREEEKAAAQKELERLEKVLAGRLLAEWKERKVPRTPLGQDAETCKRWMCDGDCPAWMACLGKLGPREQIRELMEAMGYAGGTV